MFWFKKKAKPNSNYNKVNDKARVDLIRERLADNQLTGDLSQFKVPDEVQEELEEYGTYKFSATEFARVNYDVTEWADLTEADRDVRRALQTVTQEDTSFTEPDETETVTNLDTVMDTDYWSTRS